MKKNAVKVVIVDEEYTVRSELDPDYTRQVAAHVDTAIRRVLASARPVRQKPVQNNNEKAGAQAAKERSRSVDRSGHL